MPKRRRKRVITRCEELTNTEREILRWLADGHSRAEIAREMGYSVNTIDNYLNRSEPNSIPRKIGMDKKGSLIAWYILNCVRAGETIPLRRIFLTPFNFGLTTLFICALVFLFFPLAFYNDVDSLPFIFSDVAAIIPLVAGAYGLYRYYRKPPNIRLSRQVIGWFSSGLFAWALGQFLWILWIYLYSKTVPYPSPADLGYVIAACCLPKGAYCLWKGFSNDTKRTDYWGLLVLSLVLSTLSTLWVFWARRWSVNLVGDPLKLVLDLFYPCSDALAFGLLGLLVCKYRLWRGEIPELPTATRWMMRIVTGGMLVLYGADTLFGVTTSLPPRHAWAYHNGGPADILFIIAFYVLGIGINLIPS